jgi:hypothetical protein
MTFRNSAGSSTLLMISMSPASAASIKRHGGLSQSSPDTAVLVSRTRRTPLLGSVRLNFGVDLLVRHWLDRISPEGDTQLPQI